MALRCDGEIRADYAEEVWRVWKEVGEVAKDTVSSQILMWIAWESRAILFEVTTRMLL